MGIEDLIEYDKFYYYPPVWTIGTAKLPENRHLVFDPDKRCDVQPLGHSKHGAYFPLFTSVDFAEDAVDFICKNGQPNSYVMRIDDHLHLKSLLEFYQSSGVKYVGTDYILAPRHSGYIRPIETVIEACDHAEPYGQDGH